MNGAIEFVGSEPLGRTVRDIAERTSRARKSAKKEPRRR